MSQLNTFFDEAFPSFLLDVLAGHPGVILHVLSLVLRLDPLEDLGGLLVVQALEGLQLTSVGLLHVLLRRLEDGVQKLLPKRAINKNKLKASRYWNSIQLYISQKGYSRHPHPDLKDF